MSLGSIVATLLLSYGIKLGIPFSSKFATQSPKLNLLSLISHKKQGSFIATYSSKMWFIGCNTIALSIFECCHVRCTPFFCNTNTYHNTFYKSRVYSFKSKSTAESDAFIIYLLSKILVFNTSNSLS